MMCQEHKMSGIGAVAPADRHLPVEGREPPERDGGKGSLPRRPRKPRSDADLVEVEPHKLDVEA
jgi:hypothetical protein